MRARSSANTPGRRRIAKRSKPGTRGSRNTAFLSRNFASSDGAVRRAPSEAAGRSFWTARPKGFRTSARAWWRHCFRNRRCRLRPRGLHPIFRLEGVDLVLATQLMATLPRRELGRPIASLAHERYTIVAALDMLIAGV
ncbi:MAG: CcdB family protein [Sphingomonas sp.]